ncbi:hypothetical protein RFI_19877 [Reticulomyxa filosa]|uniref:2'-phosphotransferase n=1 Tax=Reticulomyxa filosa TaxID=46433 RepID=X6MUG2_RETFI|nr:hypothetical protein RFI_19877 [Reticulomyxa filosa]|eukprot:ETO17444.1 hypothetical protein RFI_19877 [Reticulomyxa filosa]
MFDFELLGKISIFKYKRKKSHAKTFLSFKKIGLNFHKWFEVLQINAINALLNICIDGQTTNSTKRETKNRDDPSSGEGAERNSSVTALEQFEGIEYKEYVYSFGLLCYRVQGLTQASKYNVNEITQQYDLEFLLIKNKYNSEWGFPKVQNPNGFSTAIREFEEETGCNYFKDVITCDWHDPLIIEYKYKTYKTLKLKRTTIFLAHCNEKCIPSIIRPKEIAAVQWLAFKECQKYIPARYENTKDALCQAYEKFGIAIGGNNKNENNNNTLPLSYLELLSHDEHKENQTKKKQSSQKKQDYSKTPKQPKSNKNAGQKQRKLQGIQLSKTTSRILRHTADKLKLHMDKEGYVRVSELLTIPAMQKGQVTLEDIQNMVANDDKQRYSLKCVESSTTTEKMKKDLWIRANQGHSLKSKGTVELDFDCLLRDLTIEEIIEKQWSDIICHGTYFNTFELIIKSGGLSRMKRSHVHFACGDQFQIGNNGLKMQISTNNVILCSGDERGYINCEFIWKIATFNQGHPGEVIWDRRSSVAPIETALEFFKNKIWKKKVEVD